MAKLRSGILGNIRGKVAGVVGGQFKDVNYIREYVKPANPQTAAQTVQRTKMTDTVAFSKVLVGPVFNSFTDKFQKSMSGFNFFVKRNIAIFDGTPDYSAILLSEGKLSPIVVTTFTYNTGTGELAPQWSQNLGNNGSGDDKVFWCIFDSGTGIWYFQDAVVARDGLADDQTIATGLTVANLKGYLICAQYIGTILSLISNSVYHQITAP